MAEKVGEIYYEVTLDLDQMIKEQRRAQQHLDKTSSSLEGFQAKLTQVASAVAALASASYLIAQMDAYTKLSAQLKLATDSTAEFSKAMGQVKQIAQEAQTDISGVAVLYARITSATKEMGTSQAQVAAVTRAVALSLKVSGAGANEAASATLQLSQAFATGTLRGEEFNAVNEASPRLMKALADGIGLPVGQLREMAAAGKLTSEVMANALPKALKDLEQEAKSVQTIGGAFQQLRNEAALFIGEQASANGVVKVLTGGIAMLANNLTLLAGIMGTVAAVKLAKWMADLAQQAITTATANRALAASNLATAQANVAATAATVNMTTARVAELRQAVLSAQGASILAVATNGLIPAQVAAKTAADAHSVALLELSVAQKAVSVSSGIARGAVSLLGGPIGLITTLLGLGVTAWALWGKSAKEESAKAAEEVELSGREIIASLDKQNAKLRERLALAKAGNVEAAKTGGKNEERLGTLLTEINDLKAKGANMTAMEQLRLIDIQGEYDDINRALKTNRDLQEEVNDAGQRAKLPEWMKKYATDVEKANAEVAKAKKELGEAFTPELEKRIRDAFVTEKKTPKPTKTPSEKFDGAGYLAGLETATATAWEKIDLVEAESKRKNDVLLNEKKISVDVHEKAINLIREKAAKERAAIAQREAVDAMMVSNAEIAARRQLEVEIARQDSEIAGASMGTRARNEMEQRLQLVQQFAQRAQQIEDQRRTALAQADEKDRARIGNLYDEVLQIEQGYQGKSLAAYDAYVQRKRGVDEVWTNGANRALENFVESARDTASQAQSLTEKAFQGMEDALVKFAQTGKLDFKSLADSIIADLIRIQVRQQMVSAMGGSKGDGLFGMLMNGVTSLISGGSTAAAAPSTYSLTSASNYSGGGLGLRLSGNRAAGGDVSAGKMYEVNEKGVPELLTVGNKQLLMMAGQSGRVTPMGGMEVAGVPSPERRGGGSSWSPRDFKIEIINKGKPAQVESAEMVQNGSGQDIFRIFVNEAVAVGASQIANRHGPMHQALLARERC